MAFSTYPAQRAPGALSTRLTRRRALAFGAAGVAALALAACGGNAQPNAVTAPAGAASTAQAIASAVPAGALSTAQAAATAAGGAAPATTAATAASGAASDPASRNNKYKAPPPMTIDKAKKYTATIVTNKGTMKADLYPDTAPVTVNNFVFLANDKFYDGVIFHRVVPGFVIQGGDPTGTGTGGPGYKFNDEPIPDNRAYERGTLAMANSGPNTNGSQFFICLDNLTAKGALPKKYNLFGKVTEGLDTLDKILAVPRTQGGDGAQSKPTEKVFMQSVTIQTT